MVKMRFKQSWHIRCPHPSFADLVAGMSSARQVKHVTFVALGLESLRGVLAALEGSFAAAGLVDAAIDSALGLGGVETGTGQSSLVRPDGGRGLLLAVVLLLLKY